jgi:hypothetical protein
VEREHSQRLRHATGWHPGRKRDGDRDGQLAANFVDVFAAIVLDGLLPTGWPERIAIDGVESRINGGLKRSQSFHVFIAVGYEPPRYEQRLSLMRPYARNRAREWEDVPPSGSSSRAHSGRSTSTASRFPPRLRWPKKNGAQAAQQAGKRAGEQVASGRTMIQRDRRRCFSNGAPAFVNRERPPRVLAYPCDVRVVVGADGTLGELSV